MKTILAIETSTAACSVALIHQGSRFHLFEMQPQRHAHRVLQMVDEVLQQANIDDSAIDFLAYGEGPGAFTGIRIATGVIQGLALGWNKPVIAISSLEALAFAGLMEAQSNQPLKAPERVNWVALMDARMHEIYWQSGTYHFQTQSWDAKPAELLTEEIIQTRLAQGAQMVIGDIEQSYPDLVKQINLWHSSLPAAQAVARLAEMRLEEANYISDKVPLPVYLRNNVAETTAQRAAKKAMRE